MSRNESPLICRLIKMEYCSMQLNCHLFANKFGNKSRTLSIFEHVFNPFRLRHSNVIAQSWQFRVYNRLFIRLNLNDGARAKRSKANKKTDIIIMNTRNFVFSKQNDWQMNAQRIVCRYVSFNMTCMPFCCRIIHLFALKIT